MSGTKRITVDTATNKVTDSAVDFSGVAALTLGSLAVYDALAIRSWDLGSVNGTRLGLSNSKLAFFGAAPIVKLAAATDLKQGLVNLGLLTGGSPSPLNLQGGLLTAGTLNVTGNATLGGNLALTGALTAASFAGDGSGLTGFTASQIPGLDAAKIISGAFDPARIPSLDAAKISTGIFAVARIPDLDAAKTTTGIFAVARIPDLDAAKVTTGIFAVARVPDLDAAKIISGAFDPARIPSLDAAKIATGTLAVARIPDLDAGKVTTGAFAVARIPDLDAAKVATGTLAGARIPDLDWSKLTTGKPTTIAGYGITDALAYTDAVNTFARANNFDATTARSLALVALATPSAPTVVSVGSVGVSTWSYKIVARLTDGTTTTAASIAGTLTSGFPTLSGTNYNAISWGPVFGAASYDVYRTATGTSPSTLGRIATGLTSPAYNDQGAAGNGVTAPVYNATGAISGSINPALGLNNLDYIDARARGIDMTGVTDSTAALVSLIAEAAAAQTEIYLPTGTIKISSTIAITAPVKIRGTGGNSATPARTSILWAGASGGTMITITDAASCELSNVSLDGNGLAANCLSIVGSSLGYYRNLHAWHFTTGFGVKLNGSADKCAWNTFINLLIEGEGSDGNSCLWLDGNPSTGANACLNTFINTRLNAYGTNKPAIRLGGCDTNSLYSVWVGQNTSAAGVLVEPTFVAGAWRPNGNQFYQLGAGPGGWQQPSNASLLSSPNTVWGYGKSNNEPDPALNGTHTLVWMEENGGFHNLRGLDMIGDLNLTGGALNTPLGIIVRPTDATSHYAYLSLRAIDHATTSTQSYFAQHDATSPGDDATGLPNANLGVFRSLNASALLLAGPSQIVFAPSDAVAMSLSSGGVVVNSLTASSFLKTNGSKVLVSKSAAEMRTDLGLDTVWARISNSTDVAIANNTLTAIPFDTERSDTTGMHNPGGTRLTCTVPGPHTISGSVSFDINATGIRYIGFRITGSSGSPVLVLDGQKCPAVTGNYTALSFSTIFDLTVGDYVELVVAQTSGGLLSIKAFDSSSPVFSMIRHP